MPSYNLPLLAVLHTHTHTLSLSLSLSLSFARARALSHATFTSRLWTPRKHTKKQDANDSREARPGPVHGQHIGAGGAEGGGGGVGRKPSSIDEAVIRERLRALAQQAETDGGVMAGAAGMRV